MEYREDPQKSTQRTSGAIRIRRVIVVLASYHERQEVVNAYVDLTLLRRLTHKFACMLLRIQSLIWRYTDDIQTAQPLVRMYNSDNTISSLPQLHIKARMYSEMYSVSKPYLTSYCTLVAEVQVVHFKSCEAIIAYLGPVLNACEPTHSWSPAHRSSSATFAAIDGLACRLCRTFLVGSVRDESNTSCNLNHAYTWIGSWQQQSWSGPAFPNPCSSP
jgi:hypothetical protein